MNIVVRPAGAGDGRALMELRRRWGQEDDGNLHDPAFEARFAEWFERTLPTRNAWLAEDESTAVGMMSMGLFERMPKPGKPATYWGYLSNAFVAPEYRNAGVGRMLLDALLGHARQQGYARVVLHPSDRAIPFYQRAGFVPADMLLVQHFDLLT